MSELGLDTAELAKRANLEEEVVQDIIRKRRIISAKYSANLGVALDMGKQRLYKAHVSWIESGGA
jgi:plasmid maintenance system antidote protein VapI